MIKTLRIKFVKASILAIGIVLFIIIGSINLANYIHINQNINTKLDLITENGGTFPDFKKKLLPKEAQKPDISEKQLDQHGISAESPFDTRYFTVVLKEDGTIFKINTGKIAAVSTKTAADYATSLFKKGKTSGYLGDYKFQAATQTTASNSQTILYVFVDCQREIMTFRSFLFASIGISLAGMLIFFLLVLFFSKMMVRPVAESYEKQKRFITDASHEIKTPLTIIDANTEVLEMMEGENEWTLSTRKQIQRLASLTEKLVFLSRMNEEGSQLDRMEFSLSDAILDTAEPFQAVACAKQKCFCMDVQPDVSFYGDERMLRQLVSLLLDNAMKYSNEQGSIRLKFCSSGKNRILTVWNSVESIQKGNLNLLFDRFYRTDESRNSEIGGFGIGLSVALAIVQAHKGKITARSEDGASIQFTVTL